VTVLRWFRSVLERARLALTVFRKGLPKEDRETDKAVAEFISGQRKPGLPCPRCNASIIVGIPALLMKSIISCSQCGLELRMDWQEDGRARRALENLQAAALKVEQARRFRG
jgi:ssDNA-binding Zn-finger/Zn-ribbon topoisomerase 1